MGVGPDELDQSIYQNPLIERYASRRMAEHFSADHRYRIWRDLWIALAQTQAELGLPIQPQQIRPISRLTRSGSRQ